MLDVYKTAISFFTGRNGRVSLGKKRHAPLRQKLERIALIYHPEYNMDLGAHVFPARKYGMIYNLVKEDPKLSGLVALQPAPVGVEELSLVHTPEFLSDFMNLRYTDRTMYSELPLNKEIVRSFCLGVGGTILATETTENYKYVYHIGGGFHHSMPDRAEGFCYLNDAAVATKLYLQKYPDKKVLYIDLDLHQGNGNAKVFKDDRSVWTFSMHQEQLYPKKEHSSLDIPLDNGTDDKTYLKALVQGLDKTRANFTPDLIYYFAGADPFEDDSLGDLKLTFEGLKKRDKIVKEFADSLDVPVVILPAGGYARNFHDTVRIHFNTIRVFASLI
ncbi:histone deacetylase family protein [Leptospira fainei serovar Hurstbridge str. BUT 6]|uniref:Histone deacetylase family protein n=1 Tax=Leptospira fainei serovar Hurstbridge str. BUT 6 TaxID=1193011 RepID=S3VIP5_9LEPT|nr:histone deacetylase family protein [Leptospira fainei serovar Hurstbridge str. BUT 6]